MPHTNSLALLMPRFVAAVLACIGPAVAQEATPAAPQPDSLVAAYGIDPVAAALFAKVEPEFLRYQRVVFYGNTLASTQPAAELVEAEMALYRQRKAAGTLAKANRTDALLCFNLLLHRPEAGREYLAEFVKGLAPTADGFVDSAILFAVMAAGTWGEQFAAEGLASKDLAQRRFWATFVAGDATEVATAARVRERLTAETDPEVRAALYTAQGTLLDAAAVAGLKSAFGTESTPKVRAAIAFAVTEIQGRDALPWLQALEVPEGELRDQVRGSIDYLRTGTTDANKHGFEIGNDREFVERFADLHSPAMDWLRKEGRLDETAVEAAEKFSKAKKAELFDVLDASLGFGLEAVKGSLFASLEPADLPRLRTLRALCAYSPNNLASGRRRSLLIMIRSLRV